MRQITIKNFKKMLKQVALAHHEPLMVVGQFGAGKTNAIEQFAKEEGCMLHPVLLGQYDTVDLKGTPWTKKISNNFEATVWHPAVTLPFEGNPNFPDDKPIILFLDERTSASIPVMGVCYELVDKKRVGEFPLKKNVFIVSAGNREQDKGIVNREPLPLCNRETRVELAIDVNEWCEYAMAQGWPAIGIAFIRWRKDYLCSYDPTKSDKVVATPRSWEKALKYFADPNMDDLVKEIAIAGTIGAGIGAEFWEFRNIWQKVLGIIPAIKKDPMRAPLPDEQSLQYAMAVSISGNLVRGDKDITAFATYLTRMDPSFTVFAWHMAVSRDKDLFYDDEFVKFAKKYRPVFG